ncbi:hypothetical protein ACO1PF_08760 [Alkalibacterium sp. f15]|uniref:hypothetical protein n=1 Tax=Alkalibacterium sp. f15 TaxID=3414029 RepID=UPI003BF807B8
MKKILGIVMACVFLLGACDTEREPPRPGPYGENDVEENLNEEALTETDTTISLTLTDN